MAGVRLGLYVLRQYWLLQQLIIQLTLVVPTFLAGWAAAIFFKGVA